MTHGDIIVEVEVEVEGEKAISIKAVFLTQRSRRTQRKAKT
jgi:hypothetical protein